MITSMFHLFLALGSGWVVWVLLFAAFAATTVFLDRWRLLRNQERVGNLFWREKIAPWVSDGPPPEWQKAAADLNVKYPCAESRLLRALSKKIMASPESLERTTQSLLTSERMHLERNLAVLGTLGNAAPFIGLFGTVLGIIKAFSELGNATGSSGLTAISGGLAEALVTTAVGLIVAIPCAISYNFFQRKIKAIQARCLSMAGIIIGEKN